MKVRSPITMWWHAYEPHNFEEEEWNQEESDFHEFYDNPEGTSNTRKCTRLVNFVHSTAALGKAPQIREGRVLGGSFVIKVPRKDQEDWGQSQDPGSTAEHAIAAF